MICCLLPLQSFMESQASLCFLYVHLGTSSLGDVIGGTFLVSTNFKDSGGTVFSWVQH